MDGKIEAMYRIKHVDGNPYLQVINVHDFKLSKDVYELYWQDGARCFLNKEGYFTDYQECTTAIHHFYGYNNVEEVCF